MGPVRRVVLGAGVGFLALQLVPYGWTHPNPPTTVAAPWPSPEVEAIARTACYDCHSNETRWGPQSFVAPSSWLVKWDVTRGRDALNFSEWGEESEAHDAAETVEDGEMPPGRYTFIHPDARLSAADVQLLVDALEAMDEGSSGPGGGGDDEDETEEETDEPDDVDNSGPGNAGDGGGGGGGPGHG